MSTYLQRDDILDRLSGQYEDFYGQFTDLKKQGDQYVGPCPLHGGQGRNFKIEPISGGWFCHSQCGRGGDVFDFLRLHLGLQYGQALEHLARETGVFPLPSSPTPPSLTGKGAGGLGSAARYNPPPPPAPVLPDPGEARACHEKLMADPVRLDWLRVRRGLTPETLIRFGIGLTWATGCDLDAELPYPRITFPVHDRGGVLTNIRKHLFGYAPDLDRAKLPKTLPWMPGLPADLFPLAAIEEQAHVLLVEGEADALLANQLARAGQMGWAALSGTGGAGGWNPRNTRDLAGVERITILYDSDEAGRKGAKARARDLSGTVPDIRIAALPPGLGKDLTEWLMEGGGTPDALAQIIDAALPSASDSPIIGGRGASSSRANARAKPLPARIVDLADVPPPPAELPYLWGPYLNQGASHWLTGRTGLGKSTFAFNLACALAEGAALWGIECQPRRLLYVDMESGDLGRSLKIQRLYQTRPRARGQLLFVREPLRLPEESAELTAYAGDEKFDLVIFDTARRVFAVRDENDNAEVYNRIVPTLDALKALGIATLTMGHPPKNGGLSARGAGAQEDAGDINLLLTMHSGEITDPCGVIALSITKNRLLGLGQPPLFLRRVGGDRFERVDTASLPPAGAEEKLSPRDRCRLAVTALLSSNHGLPVAYKDLLHALEAQGLTRATFFRAMNELMEEGEVEQPNSGQYVLSDPFA